MRSLAHVSDGLTFIICFVSSFSRFQPPYKWYSQAISSGAEGRGAPIELTLLDVIFFFLISTEACINSYAGALRGRSPDSMSGTGMSSILSLDFYFFFRSHSAYIRKKKKRTLESPFRASLSLASLVKRSHPLQWMHSSISREEWEQRCITMCLFSRGLGAPLTQTTINSHLLLYLRVTGSSTKRSITLINRELNVLNP